MKIFITGSVGFIGFNLANFLLQNKKNKVYGIDSFDDYYSVKLKKKRLNLLKKNKNFYFKKIDICDHDNFKKYVGNKKFDMVISNPPYIADNYKLPLNVKYEPSNALFGGNIGDELLKDIIVQTKERDIKYLLCEMGYDQKSPLTKYINDILSSFKSLEFYKDYDKFDRGFTLTYK